VKPVTPTLADAAAAEGGAAAVTACVPLGIAIE